MDRERATTFAAAAIVLVLAAIALVAIDRSRERAAPARSSTAAPRLGRAPVARRPPRPVQRPPTTVASAARCFASDWLDYLAARRPVSSVRGADPALLVAFAGGAQRDPVGPGRRGLRGVRCGPRRGGRRECRALVAGLPPLRFTVADGDRPHVIALALD